MVNIDIMKHSLVPKHSILSEKELEELLKKYEITTRQLPKIYITDPCIKIIGAKAGDVVKIERKSPTSGISYAYRVVVGLR